MPSGCNVTWSTACTFWPLLFGHVRDVTALLDNWKIALSFAAVRRTFEPAHLVNLSVQAHRGKCEAWRTEQDWWISERPLGFRCRQHPWGHSLHCTVLLPECPWLAAHFPSRWSRRPCSRPTCVAWHEGRALSHARHASCRKAPGASAWQTPLVRSCRF